MLLGKMYIRFALSSQFLHLPILSLYFHPACPFSSFVYSTFFGTCSLLQFIRGAMSWGKPRSVQRSEVAYLNFFMISLARPSPYFVWICLQDIISLSVFVNQSTDMPLLLHGIFDSKPNRNLTQDSFGYWTFVRCFSVTFLADSICIVKRNNAEKIGTREGSRIADLVQLESHTDGLQSSGCAYEKWGYVNSVLCIDCGFPQDMAHLINCSKSPVTCLLGDVFLPTENAITVNRH